jgi:hypothetical protein
MAWTGTTLFYFYKSSGVSILRAFSWASDATSAIEIYKRFNLVCSLQYLNKGPLKPLQKLGSELYSVLTICITNITYRSKVILFYLFKCCPSQNVYYYTYVTLSAYIMCPTHVGQTVTFSN